MRLTVRPSDWLTTWSVYPENGHPFNSGYEPEMRDNRDEHCRSQDPQGEVLPLRGRAVSAASDKGDSLQRASRLLTVHNVSNKY